MRDLDEWHRMNSSQYRSREPIREPGHYSAWGCAWRIAVAVFVVYVLLVAVMVLGDAG